MLGKETIANKGLQNILCIGIFVFMSNTADQGKAREDRTVDLESLKALAHPLRVKIFDALSTYGPATASGLAERLGESSGATSYHLRQLARHSFVREVEGRGVGRERWWERVPGGVMIASEEFLDTDAGREASRVVVREWADHRERALSEFLERGIDELPKKWLEASLVSLTNVFVNAEQLSEFNERVMALASEFAEHNRAQGRPGTRPVQIQFHSFPVVDGDEVDDSNVGGAEKTETAEEVNS